MGCRACGLNLVCPTLTYMVQDRTPCSADVVNYPVTTFMLHIDIFCPICFTQQKDVKVDCVLLQWQVKIFPNNCVCTSI